jgi:hypothetical protein
MKMSPQQKKERLMIVEDMCICKSCPTYKNLRRVDGYIGYCHPSHGKSMMIREEKGCTCGICPVYNQNKFITSYFCTRDTDMKQKTAIVDKAWKGHSILDHITGT